MSVQKGTVLAEEKQGLRQGLRQQRLSLLPAEVEGRSRLIVEQACALPAFRQTRVVVLYSANENEVRTDTIWQQAVEQGKAVYYPRVKREEKSLEFVRRRADGDLVPGPLGILEPVGDEVLMDPHRAVVFVPGVGFDPHGHRLGRGKGYYDRAFRGVLSGALRVALAYEFQLLPAIPSGTGDERVHCIITENRIIYCPGGGGSLRE